MIEYLLLLLPLSMALMRLLTGRYIFSALVSLSCALIAVTTGGAEPGRAALMGAGLLVSVAGDYLLAHQRGKSGRFIAGVAAFGAAHVIFMAYALCRFQFRPLAFGFAMALAGLYAVYLVRRVLPGQPGAMKAALSSYALVSLAGLFCALCAGEATALAGRLYALSIASIVFSDTMIAEAEFAGNKRARKSILPTYYLCHILLVASRLALLH